MKGTEEAWEQTHIQYRDRDRKRDREEEKRRRLRGREGKTTEDEIRQEIRGSGRQVYMHTRNQVTERNCR